MNTLKDDKKVFIAVQQLYGELAHVVQLRVLAFFFFLAFYAQQPHILVGTFPDTSQNVDLTFVPILADGPGLYSFFGRHWIAGFQGLNAVSNMISVVLRFSLLMSEVLLQAVLGACEYIMLHGKESLHPSLKSQILRKG